MRCPQVRRRDARAGEIGGSVPGMDRHLVDAVMTLHGPLVTRDAATANGLSSRAVDRAVRAGVWVAVRRGVYATPEHVAAQVHRSERQRLYDDAACLRISRAHVRSHVSAAVVLGMQVLLPASPTTHVTRRDVRGSRHEHGVKHHLAPYRDDRVLVVEGVRVLDHARTALDIAREEGLVHGVVAIDSALRAGIDPSALDRTLTAMSCWPGSTVMRASLERSDGGSDSIAETLGRLLAEQLGRGRPQTQFGLREGRRTAFVDLRLGRHLIEVDGLLKYLPGATGASPQDVLRDEKQRQDWLGGFKLGMSRLTWTELWPLYQPDVLFRLKREITDTEQRFGSDISDLAPYVVARPPRQPLAL